MRQKIGSPLFCVPDCRVNRVTSSVSKVSHIPSLISRVLSHAFNTRLLTRTDDQENIWRQPEVFLDKTKLQYVREWHGPDLEIMPIKNLYAINMQQWLLMLFNKSNGTDCQFINSMSYKQYQCPSFGQTAWKTFSWHTQSEWLRYQTITILELNLTIRL